MKWNRQLYGMAVCVLVLAAGTAAQEKQAFRAIISKSTEVAGLERVASSLEAAAELKPSGGVAGHAKDVRTAAYGRLGAIGTEESIAAIKRIEAVARKIVPAPEFVPLDVWTHPSWHCGDYQPELLARVKHKDGTTYGLLRESIFGCDTDLLLVSSRTPAEKGSWTRPKLIPQHTFGGIPSRAELRTEGKFSHHYINPLVFSSSEETVIRIHMVYRDEDGDGWTDYEEQRLGLDTRNRDTDGDGLKDGDDPCPNYAPAPEDAKDEDVQILQRALFATFGLSGSRHLLAVTEKVRKVQIWGYPGPIIYGVKLRRDPGILRGVVLVSWEIAEKTENTARVLIRDSEEGGLASGKQYVLLRKIRREWFVVGREVGDATRGDGVPAVGSAAFYR